ncbi:MAG: radical SAM protein [Alphaproteobacteria bacterium]|nr:radical SAM protein [Alphaproteobacteria bacterium]
MARPISNPPNRFNPVEIEFDEAPPPARLEVHVDHSKSALVRNRSPDIPYTWSLNPYRGCTHACAYCYARAFHELLDMGAGTDFDRRIRIKPQLPERLTQALTKPSWRGEPVMLSGVTDCYQPLERVHRITRGCVEVLVRHRNPLGIITRSPLVTRDIDLLRELPPAAVRVNVSIPLLDAALARAIEPGAPAPERRLEAVAALAEAGIPVGVSVSPLIPGLNDEAVPRTLQAAREAGARWAWMTLLHLSPSVAPVFEERLREALPLRADRVLAAIRRHRDGALTEQRFGERMRGSGQAWDTTTAMFKLWHTRLGFTAPEPWPEPSPFRRPTRQLSLL